MSDNSGNNTEDDKSGNRPFLNDTTKKGIMVGCFVVSGVALGVAALPAVGFTFVGIKGGSIAAAVHSSIGLVPAGGAFATLQSLGATTAGPVIFGSIGGAVGTATGLLGITRSKSDDGVYNASLSTASGDGLKPVIFKDKVTQFTIYGHLNQGKQIGKSDPFNITITAPSGKNVKVKTVNNKDGTYVIEYTPLELGEHIISIKLGDASINDMAYKVTSIQFIESPRSSL